MGEVLAPLPEGESHMIPNIVVASFGNYANLQRLVSSIDYPVAQLLIVDNANLIDQLRVPHCVEDMVVLTMPANLGLAGSWNLGVKSFPHDPWWMFLDENLELKPGQLERLANNSEAGKFVAAEEFPNFHAFTIGEEIIMRVGLFDESLFDMELIGDEYEWRAGREGFPLEVMDIRASFLPGLEEVENFMLWEAGEVYMLSKMHHDDRQAGQWSLLRRRLNG
jgi:GT2 family glycosyltransferase